MMAKELTKLNENVIRVTETLDSVYEYSKQNLLDMKKSMSERLKEIDDMLNLLSK